MSGVGRSPGKAGAWLRRVPVLARTIACFLREADGPADGLRLARARVAWTRGLRWLAGRPRTIEASVRSLGGPVRIRTHETDPSVLAEIIQHGEYDEAAARAEEAGCPPRLVVDLGANVGLAARRFLARWPQARLVAVEPDPANARLLRENLALTSGGTSRHRVVEACVSARSGVVRLDPGNGAWGRRMAEAAPDPTGGPDAEAGPQVAAVTMAELLAGEPATAGIDLLKCDIEGAEARLFADCGAWIGRVRTAVVECHAPYTSVRLLADLAAAGSDLEPVDVRAKPSHGIEVVLLARPAGVAARIGSTAGVRAAA